ASFADHRIVNIAIVQLRRRQVPASRVDRRRRVKKIEFRERRSKIEISIVKRANCSDVFPVFCEKMSLHVIFIDGGRNYLSSKIYPGHVFLQKLEQPFVIENINTHRGQKRTACSLVRRQTEAGRV